VMFLICEPETPGGLLPSMTLRPDSRSATGDDILAVIKSPFPWYGNGARPADLYYQQTLDFFSFFLAMPLASDDITRDFEPLYLQPSASDLGGECPVPSERSTSRTLDRNHRFTV
jgi:hypothetical protein